MKYILISLFSISPIIPSLFMIGLGRSAGESDLAIFLLNYCVYTIPVGVTLLLITAGIDFGSKNK